MPNDIAADVDGDLTFQGGGLRIATDQNRDRNLITTRLMTMRGEIAGEPFLGIPVSILGKPITPILKAEIETAVMQSLLVDPALVAAKPIVKIVVLGMDRVGVLVQSNRVYSQNQTGEKLIVSGDFWTLSNMPMTALDGSEE